MLCWRYHINHLHRAMSAMLATQYIDVTDSQHKRLHRLNDDGLWLGYLQRKSTLRQLLFLVADRKQTEVTNVFKASRQALSQWEI